jgi:hydrogenase maturation protease
VKVALIGAGTILYQDEGVGVYAADFIARNYTFLDEITIIDGGVMGFLLMTYYQEYDKVILLDTITIDDEVGSVYNLPAEELLGLGSYKQTAHEVEIVEMLEICSLLEKMADVHLIGIVPKDITQVNIGLSDEMKNAFGDFVATALRELDNTGIRYKKNDHEISLESIIEKYANPSMKISDDNQTINQIQQ